MTKSEQARLWAWRFRVLREAAASPRNIARTCRHFGISRQAFYRWKRRFDAQGEAGLWDRHESAAPLAHGHAAGGRQQDSLSAAALPLRPRQDRRLPAALPPAVAGGLVGAPHSAAARDEPAAGNQKHRAHAEALAALREAAARVIGCRST